MDLMSLLLWVETARQANARGWLAIFGAMMCWQFAAQ
jgi:hypothetical protein